MNVSQLHPETKLRIGNLHFSRAAVGDVCWDTRGIPARLYLLFNSTTARFLVPQGWEQRVLKWWKGV